MARAAHRARNVDRIWPTPVVARLDRVGGGTSIGRSGAQVRLVADPIRTGANGCLTCPSVEKTAVVKGLLDLNFHIRRWRADGSRFGSERT
jgi:hypothetical protein